MVAHFLTILQLSIKALCIGDDVKHGTGGKKLIIHCSQIVMRSSADASRGRGALRGRRVREMGERDVSNKVSVMCKPSYVRPLVI